MNGFLVIAYIVWNVFVFALYGLDKYNAKSRTWRIPEKILILCAVMLGAIGAFLGMQLFRHKTRHNKFRFIIPFLVFLNIFIIAAFGFAPEKVMKAIEKLGKIKF